MRSIRQQLSHCLHLQTHRNNTPSAHKHSTIIILYKRAIMVNISHPAHQRREQKFLHQRSKHFILHLVRNISGSSLCLCGKRKNTHAHPVRNRIQREKSTYRGNPRFYSPADRQRGIHPFIPTKRRWFPLDSTWRVAIVAENVPRRIERVCRSRVRNKAPPVRHQTH